MYYNHLIISILESTCVLNWESNDVYLIGSQNHINVYLIGNEFQDMCT